MHDGLPFSKPKVRLFGSPGEAQAYLGEAYNLLFQVRSFCEASGAPVFGMSRNMPDGAIVTAAVIGDEHIVSCTPPGLRTQPEREDPPLTSKIRLNFGWLHDSGDGFPDSAGTGRFSLYSTAASRSTLEYLQDLYSSWYEVTDELCFSWGEGITYSGDPVSVEVVKAQDAALIQAKMRAYPAVGAVTGLCRQLIKGHLARPLRNTPQVAVDVGYQTVTVFGGMYGFGKCGVIYQDRAFYFLWFEGGFVKCRKLLPPVTSPRIFDFFDSNESVVRKAALATIILAYAVLDKTIYDAPIPDGTIEPMFGGWKFAYFTRKCCGVSWEAIPLVDGGGMRARVQELTFSVSQAGLTVSLTRNTSGFYSVTGSPYLWTPIPLLTQISRLTLAARPAQPPTVIHAFYDNTDTLVEVEAGNTEYVEGGSPRLVVDQLTSACGSGVSNLFKRWEWGAVTKQELSAAGETLENRFVPALQEQTGVWTCTSLVRGWTWAASSVTSGACSYVEYDTPAVGFGAEHDPMYCTHTRYNRNVTGSEGNNLAVVLPFLYTDSAIALEGTYREADGTEDERVQEYAIQGRVGRNRSTGREFSTALFPVNSLPAFTGAGLPTPPAYYTIPTGTVVDEVEVTAEAHAVFGDGSMKRDVVTDESESVYDIPLYGYTQAGNLGPYYFMPYVVHSLHGEGWGMVMPNYPNSVFSGPGGILGGVPIGVQ